MLFVSAELEAEVVGSQACLQGSSGVGAEPAHQAKAEAADRSARSAERVSIDQPSLANGSKVTTFHVIDDYN